MTYLFVCSEYPTCLSSRKGDLFCWHLCCHNIWTHENVHLVFHFCLCFLCRETENIFFLRSNKIFETQVCYFHSNNKRKCALKLETLNHWILVRWLSCQKNVKKIWQRARWQEHTVMEKNDWGLGWQECTVMNIFTLGLGDGGWLDSVCIEDGAIPLFPPVDKGGTYHSWLE